MWFYNLGAAKWQDANAITCALAASGREGIVLARPQPSPVCVGDQVNLPRVVNTSCCRALGIPIVSSQSHTRALCHAQMQLELRVILQRPHPLLPFEGTGNLRLVLAPLLETCRDLNIEAEYKAPNEIVVHGRRIALGCLSERKQCTVLSASLAVDFDADLFAGILNAPGETLRARLVDLVHARRTSIREQVSEIPSIDFLEQKVCAHLRRIVGGFRPGVIDDVDRTTWPENTDESLEARGAQPDTRPTNGWNVDIGAGTELQQRTCKAPGGFLRAECEWHNGRLVNALLGGDFLCYPPGHLQRLEALLVGVSTGQVASKVCDFYRESGWVTPGILPGHWARVLSPLSLEDYAPAQCA